MGSARPWWHTRQPPGNGREYQSSPVCTSSCSRLPAIILPGFVGREPAAGHAPAQDCRDTAAWCPNHLVLGPKIRWRGPPIPPIRECISIVSPHDHRERPMRRRPAAGSTAYFRRIRIIPSRNSVSVTQTPRPVVDAQLASTILLQDGADALYRLILAYGYVRLRVCRPAS